MVLNLEFTLLLEPRTLLFFLGILIGIDHVAGLVLGRPNNHLVLGVPKLGEVIAGYPLKLREELPRLAPFAVLAKGNFARLAAIFFRQAGPATVENLLA